MRTEPQNDHKKYLSLLRMLGPIRVVVEFAVSEPEDKETLPLQFLANALFHLVLSLSLVSSP